MTVMKWVCMMSERGWDFLCFQLHYRIGSCIILASIYNLWSSIFQSFSFYVLFYNLYEQLWATASYYECILII